MTRDHHVTRRLVAISLEFVLSLGCNSALAEDVTDFGSRPASAGEIIDALKPEPTMKTRGIRLEEVAAAPKEEPKAISMQLLFEFASADLSAEAKSHLDAVAAAMSSEQLVQYGFLVEGHTDAVGSDEYNQNLSEARAKSAKTYLVDDKGVDASRIQTVGKGEGDLLKPGEPEAAENRRVQIVRQQKTVSQATTE